ncbi:ankyrin repeat-containing domain protein [Aspergillus pseudodeflectus]|uniref:Ankyrin repeat-containing domain protein n=1 Tax=Aspergillus pseudodeflectus TaxID=176178 RepID=A0ABR4JRJ5_9EURO
MSLSSLPTELLELVGEDIRSIQTLNALSRVNRRFRNVFEPLLYRQCSRCAPPGPAVCWAARYGMMATLKRCLQYGAEIPTCAPPMQYGRAKDHRYLYGSAVAWSVENPPPPHPLCLAVQGGHLAMAELLLDRGCDANMLNPEAFSLVSLAVINNHVQLVDMLLRRGASQRSQLEAISCPIQISAFLGNKSMVELLWGYGSECLRSHLELDYALESAMAMKHKEITHLLINYGAEVDTKFYSHGSITPLQLATETGDVDLVQLLLSKRARPDYAFHDRECALVRAALKNDAEIASLVVGGSTRRAKTMALAFSVEHPDGCIARRLLCHGARPEFIDEDYGDIFPTPDKNFYLIPPLVRAVNARHGHLTRLLVEHGASVNTDYEGLVQSQSSRQSGSLLKLAMDLGDEEIISFLLEHGAQEEVQTRYDRWREMAEEDNSRLGKQKERRRLRRNMGLKNHQSSREA